MTTSLALLLPLVAAQAVPAGEPVTWRAAAGDERELVLRVDARAELVAWADGVPGIALVLEAEGVPLARAAARPGDPVAIAVVDADAALVARVSVPSEGPSESPARFAWHAFPRDAERDARVAAVRAALTELGRGPDPAVEEACAALLDRLLGDNGLPDTWAESQLARELGERAGHAATGATGHALVARAMGAAAAFRETCVPPRSRHALEVRTMQARALARTSEADAAVEALERVLPLLDEVHGPGSAASAGTRQDLAVALRAQGRLEEARDLYLEAVALADDALPAEHPEHVRLRHNAAVACYELGDLWRSLRLDREALERLDAAKRPDFAHAIRLQLAVTARALGDGSLDLEAAHRRELEELRAVLGDAHPDVLRLRSNLAGALSDGGHAEEALPLAREVLAAREASLGDAHPDTLASRLRLAQVLAALGRHAESLELQLATVEACEATRPAGDPLARRARGDVVRGLDALGRTREARVHARRWIDELAAEVRSSRVASWRERRERIAGLRPDLAALAALREGWDAAPEWDRAFLELLETARAAGAAGPLRLAAAADEADLAGRLAEHADARARLATLVAATPGEPLGPAAIEALVLARAEVDALERTLATDLDARGLLPCPELDADALARAAGPRAALLGFTAFDVGIERPLGRTPGLEPLYHVALLAPDGRVRTRCHRALGALEDAIADWRAAAGVPVDRRPVPPRDLRADAERAAAAEVLERLLGPWLDELPPEVDTLYVCLEGAAALVPLDALALPSGDVLGDRLRVLRLTSFAELLRPAAPATHARELVAVGGVDYGPVRRGAAASSDGLLPLPGTAEEARAVAGLFERAGADVVLLEGQDATRDAVRDALRGATHALLATHGTFDAAQLRGADAPVAGELTGGQAVATLAPLSVCRLALSGSNARGGADHPGRWTGEEIASEDLSGLELVVLSACDTNRSLRRGGIGVLSLQTAWHAAGARASLASLWRVKSDYGRELVERFFAGVLAGHDPADALWEAKRFLRDERGLPTRFWAGWTLSGHARRR